MDLAALHRLRVHDVNELELIWSSGTQASEIGVALKIPIPDNATNHLSLTCPHSHAKSWEVPGLTDNAEVDCRWFVVRTCVVVEVEMSFHSKQPTFTWSSNDSTIRQ